MVAADSGFATLDDLDGSRSSASPPAPPPRATSPPSSPGSGSTAGVQSVRGRRPDPAGVPGGPLRRLVVATAASSPASGRRYPDGPEALTILDESSRRSRSRRRVPTATPRGRRPCEWAIFATIQAEEFGIDSDNVEEQRRAARPQRPALPRPASTRTGRARSRPRARPTSPAGHHAGRQLRRDLRRANLTPLGLERGVNALWTDGGLLYAPPYR